MKYKAIVIGVSSGGLNALKSLVPVLPANFSIPILLVIHIGVASDGFWIENLDKMSMLKVKEADEKESIIKGCVYVAPPNYHLLVEADGTLSLSTDAKVNYARPSIDVLFESAAEAYRDKLIGIILTGSNHDGAYGLRKIKQLGGLTIVQDPAEATSPQMPTAAIKDALPNHILPLQKITDLLIELDKK